MKSWLRLLLLTLSIGGGFAGFCLTLPLLLHPAVFRLSNTLITACFLLMYALVGASGLMFAANPDRVRPLFVAFALQTPYVVWPFLNYKFAAGVLAFIFVGPPETAGNTGLYVGTELRLGAAWNFGYSTQVEPRIGINLA